MLLGAHTDRHKLWQVHNNAFKIPPLRMEIPKNLSLSPCTRLIAFLIAPEICCLDKGMQRQPSFRKLAKRGWQ